MLVSKTKHGDWFSLAVRYNQEQLQELRKTELFYCPECGEQLILKIGSKKISHFAHKQGAACSNYYERESDYHLRGKILLYEWLSSMGFKPILEPYYKEISQRPDISFVYNNVQYALEYQCSIIPEELFIKRTNNYLKANITPIWIMAGKNIKRKGNNKASLSGFDYLFLSKASQKWRITAFCPVTNTLVNLHSIYPITIKNIITQFSITDLKAATIMHLLEPIGIQRFQLEDWQNEIRKGKNISPLYGTPQNKFLQELYRNALIPSYLPPEIGLPVFHAPFIETPAIQWQSYLYIDVLNQHREFTIEQVYHSFKKRVWSGEIKIRKLPLVREGNALIAVKEYLHLLVQVNFLQVVRGNRLQKVNTKQLAVNQIQQEKMERDFYHKYGKIIIDSLNEAQ
ncbi:competence protein CoiA [Cytobacillus sp. FJAT-53684]|uniref:Competence protein CoiA n=1 Tax=Cytobacillus mangrovibacter TaxID=3299024 RepID=A0ABW6JYE2_9BACI